MVNNFLLSKLIFFLNCLAVSLNCFADETKEYYWWDGNTKRTIKVVEDILVEVPSEKQAAAEATATAAAAKTKTPGKGLPQQKISEKMKSLPGAFKVQNIEGTGAFSKLHVTSNNFHEDIKQNLGGIYSPLFEDGASSKAFAGGIIITFKDAKTDEEANTWAQAQGLKLKEKMGLANGRTWLVESAVGLASLELANQLHDSPEIESSQPNWVHDFSSRVINPTRIKTPLKKSQKAYFKKK
jgi:hypothetical protein